MSERWLPVVGYEGLYEVSDQGSVRSLDRVIRRKDGRGEYLKRGRVLSATPNTSGHLQVILCGHGHQRMYQVHRTVLAAFAGPCPDGMQGLHYDDDPSNNRLENLRWGTPGDNLRDAVRNGKHHLAAATHCKWGHEFDSANTVYRRTGGRACRKCAAKSSREYQRRIALQKMEKTA